MLFPPIFFEASFVLSQLVQLSIFIIPLLFSELTLASLVFISKLFIVVIFEPIRLVFGLLPSSFVFLLEFFSILTFFIFPL